MDQFNGFFSWSNLSQWIMPIARALLVLAGGIGLTYLTVMLLRRFLRRSKVDELLVDLVGKVAKILLFIIVAISALTTLGVSTGGLLTALAAFFAAVAISLKDSLSNISGGIILLLVPRFRHGDYILAGDKEGKVVKVDLMCTSILTYDNRRVMIPNSVLVNSVIINLTREKLRRVDIEFPIPYGTDTEFARDLAVRIMSSYRYCVQDETHFPVANISAYEDSSVTLTAKIWCETPHYWDTYFEVREALLNEMAKQGIEVPFNQLDVSIKNPPAPDDAK